MNSFELNIHAFSFDNNRPPLFSNINLKASEGTLTCIQGKNGSGKSTLFKIIKGMTEQNESVSGTIHINNSTYQLNKQDQFSSQIRAVAQNTNLMIADQFTFDENLRLAAMPNHPSLKSLPQAVPHDIIKQFGIDGSTKACLLSGGQRQILSILMALQKPTAVLLLDEPTAALDETNARIVFEFLRQLLATRSLTIISIVHDPELVERYGDQSVHIEQKSDGTRTLVTKIINDQKECND